MKKNNFRFSKRSINNLLGVNPLLIMVVAKALELSSIDFTVVEGVRTIERQKEMVAKGVSKTMNSYHIPNENGGRAVDIYPYYAGSVQVQAPKDKFTQIANTMKQAAKELNVTITWGGDFKSFFDGPHFQIEI